MSSNGGLDQGDSDVDALIERENRIAEIAAENNYRVGDNHLLLSDRVIANAAALKLQNEHPLAEVAEVLKANPT